MTTHTFIEFKSPTNQKIMVSGCLNCGNMEKSSGITCTPSMEGPLDRLGWLPYFEVKVGK